MPDPSTYPFPTGDEAVLTALGRSARRLAADPAAHPTPAFRRQGRAALWRAMSSAPSPRPARLTQRLIGVGLAAMLFGLVAMPALAGPGAVVESVSSAAGAVGQIIGLPPTLGGRSEQRGGTPAGTATATGTPPGTAVAQATPVPGQNHGQQVREEARDNRGHQVVSAATGTAVAGGAQPGNHGADVSAIAQATPVPGQNHGQQVSEEARDNHGQGGQGGQGGASGQGGKKADTATATAEPTPGNEGRGNRGRGNAQATPTVTPTPAAPAPDDGDGDGPGKGKGSGKSDDGDKGSGGKPDGGGGKGGGRGR